MFFTRKSLAAARATRRPALDRSTELERQSPGHAKLLSAAVQKGRAKPSEATAREVDKENLARPSTVDEIREAALLAKEAARTSEAKQRVFRRRRRDRLARQKTKGPATSHLEMKRCETARR